MVLAIIGAWRIVVNTAANIQQTTAATRSNVEGGLQEVDGLPLLICGEEVFQHALQHLFIGTQWLQFTGKVL